VQVSKAELYENYRSRTYSAFSQLSDQQIEEGIAEVVAVQCSAVLCSVV
jgi:hypothetical protein